MPQSTRSSPRKQGPRRGWSPAGAGMNGVETCQQSETWMAGTKLDKPGHDSGETAYCNCMPDAFTTPCAAARSALIWAANCSGVLIAGTWPRLITYLSTNSLSPNTRVTSVAILSMTAFGVPGGANNPYQVCDGAPL